MIFLLYIFYFGHLLNRELHRFLFFILISVPSVPSIILLSAAIWPSFCASYPSLYSSLLQVHPTSECVVDEGRRSQGNHGYQTRAAMEETSRQSAEAADDDESTSEVGTVLLLPCFECNFILHGRCMRLILYETHVIHKVLIPWLRLMTGQNLICCWCLCSLPAGRETDVRPLCSKHRLCRSMMYRSVIPLNNQGVVLQFQCLMKQSADLTSLNLPVTIYSHHLNKSSISF